MLDVGRWSKEQRSALRALSVGATCELVYLDVDEAEQWKRVQTRSLTTRSLAHSATTVPKSEADVERFRQLLQPPDAAELAMTEIEALPSGFASWEAWAAERWPTPVF